MKLVAKLFLVLAGVLLLGADSAQAQATAVLRGTVIDPLQAGIPAAQVRLIHPLSGFERSTVTDRQGRFELNNVPFQGYELHVVREGFRSEARSVELRSNLPVSMEISLDISAQVESMVIETTARGALLDTESTGTKTQLSRTIIEKLPIPPSARGLEAVILGFPGFAANANGSIHPRGAHNQMTYVIDGMPITDQFSGQFATSIDPSVVQSLDLYTGNIPPEYGAKVSGVANITTRSGFDGGGRTFGQVELGGGGFDSLTQSAQVGGAHGKLGWFGSGSSIKSNRFLDSPSFDNLHNGGNAQRGSFRLDWQRSERDVLRFSGMAGRSSFQLANLRSQHANGQAQRRLLDDISFGFGYVRVLSPTATFESTTSYRDTTARLRPSAGDTPVTASLRRTLATVATFNRFHWQRRNHGIHFGLDAQRFPVSESFAFGITDPGLNDPRGPGFNSNLLPFDLTRGGGRFQFHERGAGYLYTGFIRDQIDWGPFVLDLGLRFDRYAMVVRESQLQPRVGLAYHLRRTGTVFRASYNRNFQTPPNENLLLANSPSSARLAQPEVQRTLSGGVVPIQTQRQNVYEAGLQQELGRRLSVDAAFYHKNSSNAQDNDNFLNTGIIFPTSLAFSRVNGVETRIVLTETRGVSGSLSLTHFRAIVTPPFTGGLFLGSAALDALTEGPFVIDHDQALGASGNLIYRPVRRWWTSWQVRHDSGLVSNPSDPAEVAADPDYYDQLPYVDLLGDPPRIRPRTIMDASVGYEHYRGDRRVWELAFQISNLTNRKGLYSFQSVFVGTRAIQPLTASVKLRIFW